MDSVGRANNIFGKAIALSLMGSAFVAPPAEADVVARPKKAQDSPPTPVMREQTRAALAINIPLERITRVLNQFDFNVKSKGLANVPIVGQVHYEGFGAAGQITVKASNQPQLPIELKAPFRWNGTIASFDVTADGELTIDFGINVGPDWCPVVELGEPALQLFPDKAINLANVPYANTVLSKMIAEELKNQLSCEAVKKRLATFWHETTLPLQIGTKTFVVNIKPESVALTSATVTDGRLILKSSLALTTVLSGKARKAQKLSLPQPEPHLQPVTSGDGDLDLEVSVKMGVEFP